METDPAPSPYWFRPALLLLEYVRESIAELAKVCVCASCSTLTLSLQDSPPLHPSPTPSLPNLLRPLVTKNVKTSLAQSMLLLWLLDVMVTHLPTVEVSTGVCMYQSTHIHMLTCESRDYRLHTFLRGARSFTEERRIIMMTKIA